MVKEGRTLCSVYRNDKLLEVGTAHLSEQDQYDRRIGRKVSLTRALRSKVNKADRTMIWAGLRQKGVGIKN